MSDSKHGSIKEGSTCASCWDDMSTENYVEYREQEDGLWLPSGFCQECIGMLLSSQYEKYCETLASTKCKAEQRRLLDRGPPINIFDKTALPCSGGDYAEVNALWYMSDGEIHSAKLKGSLEGEDREKFWEEQKSFRIQDENDDPDDKSAV